MPRALILSYHFYPSGEVGAKRVSELARQLHAGGWEVTAITAPADHVEELAGRVRGIEILPVAPPPKLYPQVAELLRRRRSEERRTPSCGGEPTGAERAANWRANLKRNYNALEWTLDDRKGWAWRAAVRGLSLRRHWDWIVSSGPPVSAHLAARFLAGWSGARWLMDLRDPWVGNEFWPAHVRSRLRDAMEQRLEASCIRRADRITVSSPGIARGLLERSPEAASRVAVVLNGYDGTPADAAQASGRLRLLYAGTLYFNRDPFPLLEAFASLVRSAGVDRRRVSFTLVGNCAAWNDRSLTAWVETEGLADCVHILPAVAPAAVREMMVASEVLVNFAQGQRDQIPAKVYDYIASGREMLLIAETDSDAARVTRESGCGRIVEPMDRTGLSLALSDLYTHYVERGGTFRPVRETVGNFSRRHQNSRFMELLSVPAGR
jgi:hypothetical protein